VLFSDLIWFLFVVLSFRVYSQLACLGVIVDKLLVDDVVVSDFVSPCKLGRLEESSEVGGGRGRCRRSD
jgi:hypothetical protein